MRAAVRYADGRVILTGQPGTTALAADGWSQPAVPAWSGRRRSSCSQPDRTVAAIGAAEPASTHRRPGQSGDAGSRRTASNPETRDRDFETKFLANVEGILSPAVAQRHERHRQFGHPVLQQRPDPRRRPSDLKPVVTQC
jgi:hypothetical protein